jgi:DNA-binding MarR family transcriptional regulator
MVSEGEFFARGYLLCMIIRGLYSSMEEDVRVRVKNLGVTNAGFRILWVLNLNKKMTMTELAHTTQLNISSIYRQLEKLKEKGFAIIQDCKNDARIKEIDLTEKGEQFIQDVIKTDGHSPSLRLIPLTEKIPKEDLDKFIKVGSFLCSELISQKYMDRAVTTANNLSQKVNSRS